MQIDDFAERYPTLYHMADETAWPSIERHGLLSTRAMVDLHAPEESIQSAILNERRTRSFTLHRDGVGPMTVRDQLPLKFLSECLLEGVAPQDFLDALNERVFFWVSRERVQRLLNARAYRDRPHIVIHMDTAAILEAHGAAAELAPYNTGSLHVPNLPKRGPQTFVPLEQYPFDYWRHKRGRYGEAVVEFTVPGAIPNLARFVRRVERWQQDQLLNRVV
jgi:hypothetical protein